MVGVAGRSKGCKTCRERKIKCDEGRPGCTRCLKIGRECPGYARPLHFVYSTQQKISPISWEEAPTTTIESDQLQVVVANTVSRKPKAGSKARQKEAARSNSTSTISDALVAPNVTQRTPLNVCIPFNRSEAYVNVYVQDFIHVSAPRRTFSKDAMVPYRFGHIYPLEFRTGDTPETRKELEDAYSACAATYFALKEKDVSSKIHGHILYLKLLRQLKGHVKNGLANSDPAVFLYICMMASHYEVLTSWSTMTWLYHLTALGRLISSLGPHSFHDPLAAAILEIVRPYIVLVGIMERKRSFLEQEVWISVPAQSYPGGKSPWNQLTDLSTSFPRLFEEGYALAQNITHSAATLHLENLTAILSKLFAWRRKWSQTYGREPHTYLVPSSSFTKSCTIDEEGPLFDTVFFFDDISTCTTIFQYNTFAVACAHHLSRFIPWFELHFGLHDVLTIRLRRAIAAINPDNVCREIARCLDYQCAPRFEAGSTGMVFGAKAAYDISDKNSRMGKCFGRAIFNSPVMQRERATGGGNNPGDLLAVWYGPDPPTPEDTLRVRQMQLQLQLELELEQELAAQQQQLDAKGLLLDPFDLGFDPERVILV